MLLPGPCRERPQDRVTREAPGRSFGEAPAADVPADDALPVGSAAGTVAAVGSPWTAGAGAAEASASGERAVADAPAAGASRESMNARAPGVGERRTVGVVPPWFGAPAAVAMTASGEPANRTPRASRSPGLPRRPGKNPHRFQRDIGITCSRSEVDQTLRRRIPVSRPVSRQGHRGVQSPRVPCRA